MFEDEQVLEMASALLGSAVVALVGFVWKVSHRVTTLQNKVDSLEASTRRDVEDLRREIDQILANVDKNREWTTNRMISIVRDSKD